MYCTLRAIFKAAAEAKIEIRLQTKTKPADDKRKMRQDLQDKCEGQMGRD
jgi:hypothetical protein